MLHLGANKPSVIWNNHMMESHWISWWLSIAGFSPWFPVAPHLWPCHYRLLVFAITPCLLLSFPSAVEDAYVTQHTMHDHQRCCLTERNQFAPSLLALPFPIAQSLFLSSLCGTCSWSLLLVRLNSGSPNMVTDYCHYHSAHWVWGLFFMKGAAQRQTTLQQLLGLICSIRFATADVWKLCITFSKSIVSEHVWA